MLRRPLALTLLCAAALAAPASAEAAIGGWLGGDLHVHTCFSHDVYCGPADDNTGPEEIYTLGSPVGMRFQEAAARGLDYLAITDHNDVRSLTASGRGGGGVVPLGGYEASLNGHAQALGAKRVYPPGDKRAPAINSLAAALRADGGVFQINHPGNQISRAFERCSDTSMLDWTYGYDVRPDVLEVWNNGTPLPPSERYFECWLNRGARVGVTGGSDSHWLTLALLGIGIGAPTTWAQAETRTEAGVLAALRAGRTAVSKAPPAYGGAPLLLEADGDGDGRYEVVQGSTVRPGVPLRVRSLGARTRGWLRVRSNGTLFLRRRLPAGGVVAFRAPGVPGWVRASLHAIEYPGMRGECGASDSPISTCEYDSEILALTSPVYLREPGARGGVRFSYARRAKAATLRRRRGVRVTVSCAAACRVGALARIGGRRAGSGRVVLSRPGRRTFTVSLDRRAVRALRRGTRIGLRLTVAGGPTTRTTVTVR